MARLTPQTAPQVTAASQADKAATASPAGQAHGGPTLPAQDRSGPVPPTDPPVAGPAEERASAQAKPCGRPTVYGNLDQGMALLPKYTRSLLHVMLPVTVTLASTRQPLSHILELSPGSIIQFNKLHTAPLTLEAGRHTVALGEAVKVGDKFGLWITSMAMPGERFWVLSKKATNIRAK